MRDLADHQFYRAGAVQVGEAVAFGSEEARHAGKALRLRPGDQLRWTDGRGGRFVGVVEALGRQEMVARVETLGREAGPPRLHLAVGALHDAARAEWLVEKATELGATDITLVRCARTERTSYRTARLEAKVLAALKQSGRAWLPTLRECDLTEVLMEEDVVGLRAIAHCYADLPRVPLAPLSLKPEARQGCTILIGPEGDFTREEVAAAKAAGFRAVKLGDTRLRSETAALAALAIVALG